MFLIPRSLYHVVQLKFDVEPSLNLRISNLRCTFNDIALILQHLTRCVQLEFDVFAHRKLHISNLRCTQNHTLLILLILVRVLKLKFDIKDSSSDGLEPPLYVTLYSSDSMAHLTTNYRFPHIISYTSILHLRRQQNFCRTDSTKLPKMLRGRLTKNPLQSPGFTSGKTNRRYMLPPNIGYVEAPIMRMARPSALGLNIHRLWKLATLHRVHLSDFSANTIAHLLSDRYASQYSMRCTNSP